MRIRILPDPAAVAVEAADRIRDAVRANPRVRLGLPTGGTPVAAYAELTRRAAAREIGFSGVTAWAVDEFAGASRDTPGTNSVFFRQHLRLPLRALHIPNPAANDPGEHIAAFAGAIRSTGGLDLCVLGIGVNGHIAFNEPPSPRDTPARVVDLAKASREAHAAAFGGIERVPVRGMTLGVADLLAAHAVLVLAHGAHKAAAVRAAIEGATSPDVPASWLQTHNDVTWLLDTSAASALRTDN